MVLTRVPLTVRRQPFTVAVPPLDHGALANPGILPDRDPRPGPWLLADRDVESLDAVLSCAVDYGHVRSQEHVVFQCHVAQAAVRAHVNAPAHFGGRVRKDHAETQAGVCVAAGKNQPVESAAKVYPEQTGDEAKSLGPARKCLLAADEQASNPEAQVAGKHESQAQAVGNGFQQGLHDRRIGLMLSRIGQVPNLTYIDTAEPFKTAGTGSQSGSD